MRKIKIPYSNFMNNSPISSSQINLNFDEIEYVFNDMYEDYIGYKQFMRSEFVGAIDDEIVGDIVNSSAYYEYNTGYATDDEITEILNATSNQEIVGDMLANSIRGCFATEEEIKQIVKRW